MKNSSHPVYTRRRVTRGYIRQHKEIVGDDLQNEDHMIISGLGEPNYKRQKTEEDIEEINNSTYTKSTLSH